MTPSNPSRRAVIAGGLMGLTAAASVVFVPKPGVGNVSPKLEETIPKSFAGWNADDTVTPLLPDAQRQAVIEQIYDETLARTYRNPTGGAVMLVIAYGSRQTETLQAHDPAGCYAAQGFQVREEGSQPLPAPYPALTANRVYAELGARTEPILYWLAVSGAIADFGAKLRLQQIKLGLKGIIPEGFLVRASLIGPDEPSSYDALGQFMSEMLQALPPALRQRMAGV